MTAPTKFTIDRSRWCRGDDGNDGALLRTSDQKMCCLGFFGLACGIPFYLLADIGEPIDMISPSEDEEGKSSWPEWAVEFIKRHDGSYIKEQSDDIYRLMAINDDYTCSETYREQLIAEIFARHGVEVEFVDGAPVEKAK